MGSGSILDSNIVIYYLEGALDLSARVVVEKAIMAGTKLFSHFENRAVMLESTAGVKYRENSRETHQTSHRSPD